MKYLRWIFALFFFALVAWQILEYNALHHIVVMTEFVEPNQAHIAAIAMLLTEFLLGLTFTVETDIS